MRGWKSGGVIRKWRWEVRRQIMAVMMMMMMMMMMVMVTSTPTPMTIGTRVGNTTDTVSAPRAIATATATATVATVAAATAAATAADVATSTIIGSDRQSGRLPSGNRYNNTTISPSRISSVDAPQSPFSSTATTSSRPWPWSRLVNEPLSDNSIDEDTDEKVRPIASFPKYSTEFTNMFKQIVAISRQKSQYLWKIDGLSGLQDELQIGCEEGFTQIDNSSQSNRKKRETPVTPASPPAQVVVVVVPYVQVPSSNHSSNSSDFSCFLEAIQRLISHNQPIPINKRSEPDQQMPEFHKSRPPGVINREHQLDNSSLTGIQSSQNIHSPTVNREIVESGAPNSSTVTANSTSSTVSLLDMSATQNSTADCDINNLTSCAVKEKVPQNRRRRPPPEYPGPLPSPMENRGRSHTAFTTMQMLALLNSSSSDPSPEPASTTVF